MKKFKDTITELPDYLVPVISDKENIVYLEQLRVKEYSNKLATLAGNRKALIPFSGGLDSTASLLMALESGVDVITVNFNYGQTYFEKERKVIQNIEDLIKVKYTESYNLWKSHYEIDISWIDQALKAKLEGNWKHIFPFRNYVIIQETAKLANKEEFTELWFSCVKGEVPYSGGDKSIVFLSKMSDILSTENILLVTPHLGLEKTDIVNWALSDLRRYDIIKETISCFGDKEKRQCGECQSCFNRGVAFFSNGKIEDVGFDATLVGLKEFTNYYKMQLNQTNYYSSTRKSQVQRFISFLEKND